VPGLGTSFGRGGATTAQQDLSNSDAILIMGSSMAENHPVGFQWVMEARERGAKIIHVDPRFTRTSAMADIWVPLRAGTDILFLGGLINYVLENNKYFHDYVTHYTNAPVIINDKFQDTEDLGGVFSGFDPESHEYDPATWLYAGSEIKAADSGATHAASSGGHALRGSPGGGHGHDRGGEVGKESQHQQDRTLQNPRCVFQLLKKHFARYTPEMVERYCGIPRNVFLKVAEAFSNASGPDKTAAICYAVGWTQHSKGVTDHPLGGDFTDVAREHRATGRRDSGAARPRFHPGLHRHTHALRHPAGVFADAVLRIGLAPLRAVRKQAQQQSGAVGEL
jgi:formate dehydrogenase major subunit